MIVCGMQIISCIIPQVISLSSREARNLLQGIRPKAASVSYPVDAPDSDLDLSIIIPCYNVSQYVGECIESILSQESDQKYEVILVDDGSTDSTLTILHQYAARDSRIRCITQRNSGPAIARNTGLNAATGRYVMFVDSDDQLASHAIQTLMDSAKQQKADIISGSYVTFPIKEPVDHIESGIASNDDEKFQCPGVPWGKVYRRDLFKDIRYPEHVEFEDTVIHFLILPLCSRLVYIPNIVYRYRINEQGITRTFSKTNKGIDTIWVVEILMDWRKQRGITMNAAFYRFLLTQLGKMTYVRVCNYDEIIIQSVFILAADIIQAQRVKTTLNWNQRMLERAFLSRNIRLWKISSRY